MQAIKTGQVEFGEGKPLVLIAGPCVVESEQLVMNVAEYMVELCHRLNIPYIFKASYVKANRTSINSFIGPGPVEGLNILQKVKTQFNVPILTDIHHPQEASVAAEVADVLQIPAFLSRQTDLLTAAGRTGKIVNIKKGQFLSPFDMANAAKKPPPPETIKSCLPSAAPRLATIIW